MPLQVGMADIEAIVFDWDGSLLFSFEAAYKAYRLTLARFNIVIDRNSLKRFHSPNWRQFYQKIGLPKNRWDAADDLWKHYYQSARVILRPQAKYMLQSLSNRFSLGLVTAGNRSRVQRELTTKGLMKLFSCVICDEDCSVKKPGEEPLIKCLSRIGVLPSKSVYFGDTYEDALMGLRAGVSTILIRSGYTDEIKVRELGPITIINNLSQILELFSHSGEIGHPMKSAPGEAP